MTVTQPVRPAAAEPVQWYRMEADSASSSAEVFIYGAIGGWFGVDATQFVRDIATLDVKEIQLRVNSPGGSVYDGVAIMNALKRHKAKVVASVDGIAASAASFIIMAADEIQMGPGSEVMIHDAWAYTAGNAGELTDEAAHLDRISNSIASLYASRAGGTAEEWRDAMKAESWYSAKEAVAAGLADSVTGDTANKATDSVDAFTEVSRFLHTGRGNAPTPWMPPGQQTADSATRMPVSAVVQEAADWLNTTKSRAGFPPGTEKLVAALADEPHEPNAPQTVNTTNAGKGTDDMSAEVIKGLRERIGIPAEATLNDNEILAALDEALAEQAEPTNAVTAAAAAGTVVLDEAAYNELKDQAAQGSAARKQQLATDRANLVNAAVNDGRIAPARREHWVNTLEADPGMEAALAGLAKGLVPLEAAGYTGGVDEASDENSTYSKIFNTTKES
ncbi:ATP-dependent Clp endopeptidase, proteolytic subunit ClpP [Arthrobacter alpinus]|uniref:ATP-dependent Clp protease proteolytic subunit n=1 Tax=Arthrobacter alpinus TaxID=656366 RepID=A0A1H5HF43_9MICC|nr:head maturation protease, ClpP-related [Arthrobacter alpinus]SEE26241.1 ATP-dependent Clp endopeptidase, proteolytic subunit ClpP [Arthrobacter alpinus]